MPDMGYHYTPCRNGSGAVAAVIIGALLIGSGALTAAVAALTDLVMIVLACGGAAGVIVTTAGVLAWQKYGRGLAPIPDQLAAFRAAREFEAAAHLRAMQQRPARQIEAPAQQHFHLHLHGTTPQPEDMPVVLQAIRERSKP